MDTLQNGIDAYNQTFQDLHGEDDELACDGPAPASDIERFQALAGMPLPAELVAFYRHFGSLKNNTQDDNHCFWLPAPGELVDWLEDQGSGAGLVSLMRAFWGGDRPELDAGTHFDAAQLQALDQRFIGFGWFMGDDMLEGAHFLFFDRAGGFGRLHYHQDRFAEARRGLLGLLESGLPGQSLEALLGQALDEVREGLEAFG